MASDLVQVQEPRCKKRNGFAGSRQVRVSPPRRNRKRFHSWKFTEIHSFFCFFTQASGSGSEFLRKFHRSSKPPPSASPQPQVKLNETSCVFFFFNYALLLFCSLKFQKELLVFIHPEIQREMNDDIIGESWYLDTIDQNINRVGRRNRLFCFVFLKIKPSDLTAVHRLVAAA